MVADKLLTFAESSERLGLASPDNFARFAKRYGIPVIRFGPRIARIRSSDLERAIQRRTESTNPAREPIKGA